MCPGWGSRSQCASPVSNGDEVATINGSNVKTSFDNSDFKSVNLKGHGLVGPFLRGEASLADVDVSGMGYQLPVSQAGVEWARAGDDKRVECEGLQWPARSP